MERKESSKRTVYKKNFRKLLERKQKEKRERAQKNEEKNRNIGVYK